MKRKLSHVEDRYLASDISDIEDQTTIIHEDDMEEYVGGASTSENGGDKLENDATGHHRSFSQVALDTIVKSINFIFIIIMIKPVGL